MAFLISQGTCEKTVQVSIVEEVNYSCSSRFHYTETSSHAIRITLRNVQTGKHNLTTALTTTEDVISVNGPGLAESSKKTHDGNSVLTIMFESLDTEFYVSLGGKGNYPDPFDFMILPKDANILPADRDGRLSFDVSVNSTSQIRNVGLQIVSNAFERYEVESETYIAEDNRRGVYPFLRLDAIQEGNHTFRYHMISSRPKGDFSARAECKIPNELTLGLRCMLDGSEIEFTREIHLDYSTDAKSFARAELPGIYYYDGYSENVVGFIPLRELVLRIDAGSREQIQQINLPEIEDLEVIECTAYDNPCYQLRITLKDASNCTFSILLQEKHWFSINSNAGQKHFRRKSSRNTQTLLPRMMARI